MSRIVVLTGGGIKGAVAAARCAADNDLILVHVAYGQQSASAELRAVEAFRATLPFSSVMALTMGHVTELQQEFPGLSGLHADRTGVYGVTDALSEATLRGFTPVLLSVGVQCALRAGAKTVVTGLSSLCDESHLGIVGDGGTTDRRHEFLHSFNLMMENLPTPGSNVRVEAPLIDVSLSQAVKLARRFGVPLEKTWTCQRSGPRPCRRCESCQARARAFIEASMIDPLSAEQPAPA